MSYEYLQADTFQVNSIASASGVPLYILPQGSAPGVDSYLTSNASGVVSWTASGSFTLGDSFDPTGAKAQKLYNEKLLELNKKINELTTRISKLELESSDSIVVVKNTK